MSEKFQLVLDVAQKAQVRRGGAAGGVGGVRGHGATPADRFNNYDCLFVCFVLTESVREDGKHPGEDQEVSVSARTVCESEGPYTHL